VAPDYRTPTCAYCEAPSLSPCPRCGCNACADHRLERWCSLCERERIDERDFAVATAKLRSPTLIDTTEDDRYRVNSLHVSFNLISLLVHVVTGPYRTWRARDDSHRAFVKRTAEEIDAWRRINAPDVFRR
jgi:hypothetical protein